MKRVNFTEIIQNTKNCDLFICSSSFEKRCLEIPSNINADAFKHVIICHFEDNYQESNQNLVLLQERFKDKHTIVYLSKDNPLSNFDMLVDNIQKCDDCENSLLDISTFTREILLIIIQIFKLEQFKQNKLYLCYNPSDKYSNASPEQIDKLWLSKGVQNIRAILGYSGDLSPIKQLMLIVLVGFEAERSQIIIDNFEPNKLYIGKSPSQNSVNQEMADINSYHYERLLQLNPNAEKFEFSCKDIQETSKVLSDIILFNKDNYNIVICPMNNKISTLAAASVAFKFSEIQICYSSTNQYNIDAYSTPSKHAYIIDAQELYG